MFRRVGAAMPSSLSEKACITLTALEGSNSGDMMSMSSLRVHSTKVPRDHHPR